MSFAADVIKREADLDAEQFIAERLRSHSHSVVAEARFGVHEFDRGESADLVSGFNGASLERDQKVVCRGPDGTVETQRCVNGG